MTIPNGHTFSYSAEISGGIDSPFVTTASVKVTILASHAPTLNIITNNGGTTNPLPGIYPYDPGTNVTVTASPFSYWYFGYWSFNGVFNGTDLNTTVTVSDNDVLYAHFLYDVTLQARCPDDMSLHVQIYEDGELTGYSTPHTFIGLEGVHNFGFPPYDQHHQRVDMETITVSFGVTYTAQYYLVVGGSYVFRANTNESFSSIPRIGLTSIILLASITVAVCVKRRRGRLRK